MAEKFAIRKLIRNYDTGRMNVVFVDASTGEVVTDLTGYQLIESGTDSQLPQVSEEEAQAAEDSYDAGLTNEVFDVKNNAAEEAGRNAQQSTSDGVSALFAGLPFVGDFFTKSPTDSFPAAPAPMSDPTEPSVAQETVTDAVVGRAEETPWSETAGRSITSTAPSSGTGPGGVFGPTGWVDDASKSLTSTSPVSEPSSRGRGLAALDGGRSGWSGASLTGLDADTSRAAATLGNISPGGLTATSGYRDPGENSRVGGKPGSAHMEGKAIDVSVRGKSDDERSATVERGIMSGFGRIGAYSGNTGLHMDTRSHSTQGYGGVHPMFDTTIDNMSKAPGWFSRGLDADPTQSGAQSRLAPTPSFYSRVSRDPMADAIAYGNPTTGIAQNLAPPGPQATNRSAVTAIDPTISITGPASVARGIVERSVTPAEVAGLGYASRSKSEKSLAAVTLAGEMGRKGIAGLVAGEPVAIEEAKNILGVMENRAAAKRAETLSDVVTPAAFDALKTGKMGITTENYGKHQDVFDGVVDAFYSGKLGTPSVAAATHYYNPEAVARDPGWSRTARSMTQVGEHHFASDVMTADMSRVEYGLPMTDPVSLTSRSFGPAANTGMSFADQYSAYGRGNTGSVSSFGAPANTGMSVAGQYGSYGQGRSNSTSSFGPAANTGMSISAQYGSYGQGKSGVATGPQAAGHGGFLGYVAADESGARGGVSTSPSVSAGSFGGWGTGSSGNNNSPNAGGGQTSSSSTESSSSGSTNSTSSSNDSFGGWGTGSSGNNNSPNAGGGQSSSSSTSSADTSGGLGGWGGWI